MTNIAIRYLRAGVVTGYIGRKTINYINHLFNLLAFSAKLVGLIIKSPTRGGAVIKGGIVEQVYFTAVQALFLVVPLSLLLGGMMLVRFAEFSGQIGIGKITIILIVREIGPILTAILVILRSATAVTIEISYMNVLNEIESLEMAGIDPMRFLSIPRFIGITLAIFCLFIVFDLVAILGGYGVIRLTTSIPIDNYLAEIANAVTVADIVVGIVKAVCFGIVVSVTSLYHGFEARKQITSIPQVTSNAAIECFIYCIIINVFISAIFYM